MEFSYPHPPLPQQKHWLQANRPGVPIMLDPYMQVWGKKMIKKYYTFALEYEDAYWYFTKQEAHAKLNCLKFGYAVLEFFLDNERFSQYLSQWQQVKNRVLNVWDTTSPESITTLSEKQLTEQISVCQNLLIDIWATSPLAGVIGNTATEWSDWWLDQRHINKEDRPATLAILLDYPEQSETLKRQVDIAEQIDGARPEDRNEVMRILIQKYCFAKSNFAGYSPYDETDVLRDYEMAKEYTPINTTEQRALLLKNLGATEIETRIFDRFGYSQFSRDERMSYEQRMFAIIDWCVKEIGSRRSIDPNILRYALTDELTIENLNRSKFIDTLRDRWNNGFLFCWKDSEVGEYISGKEAQNLYEIAGEKHVQKKEFKGQVAYKGKVTGRAKIIMDPNVPLEDEGYILVTSMTSPDFVQHMRRALAVVTNEGGITCHAAILSRELQKPCIIGTKIATTSIKDGDLIEIDAERGIVRILS